MTVTDRSIMFPSGIGTIILFFCTKNFIEKIFYSRVCYYSKLDIKFISLKVLVNKSLFYLLSVGIFKIWNRALTIISGYLTAHNLYKVDLQDIATNCITISQKSIMAKTSKSAANLLIWHYCLAFGSSAVFLS